MNTTETSFSTRFKVGLFTALGLLLIGAVTVFVNDKPYWWRSCQLVHINVEDATGLKMKSPVRSLGLEIGYLKSVELFETHVSLGICITAPVEVLPSTRAYLRGEGFLGDKFVELKPVKYIGPPIGDDAGKTTGVSGKRISAILDGLAGELLPEARAEEPAHVPPAPVGEASKRPRSGREIPVGAQGQDMQQLVNRVDSLVNEMTNLTSNLRQAINPEELRNTMKQLNRTLENASKTLAPEGGLNQTAQRTLAKLEDAIEQLRDVMTRVNKGEGSVGMLLNDPSYAQEIREAIKNVNRLLSKVGGIRFVVDIGGEEINAYDGGRGWFRLQIWPKPDRYYLLGISVDPRGRRTQLTTTTTAGGQSTTTSTVIIEQTGILVTGMLGKVYMDRIDLSVGALNGDGDISAAIYLGPRGFEDRIKIMNDVYTRGSGIGVDDRVSFLVRPLSGLYLMAGIESFKSVDGRTAYAYGAGVTFDDEDIKLLFALR